MLSQLTAALNRDHGNFKPPRRKDEQTSSQYKVYVLWLSREACLQGVDLAFPAACSICGYRETPKLDLYLQLALNFPSAGIVLHDHAWHEAVCQRKSGNDTRMRSHLPHTMHSRVLAMVLAHWSRLVCAARM